MTIKNKENSNVVRIQSLSDLQGIVQNNVKEEDRYQKKTAEQIEILQNRLAKEHDDKNQILFWSIFGGILLLNCVVFQHIQSNLAIFGILVMEFVAISCSANKLGQENALKLLNWLKNMAEEWIHNVCKKEKK